MGWLSAKHSTMGNLFNNILPLNKDLCRCPNLRRFCLWILCSAKKVDTFSKASKPPHCNRGSSRAVYQQSSDHYSICHFNICNKFAVSLWQCHFWLHCEMQVLNYKTQGFSCRVQGLICKMPSNQFAEPMQDQISCNSINFPHCKLGVS